MAAELSLPVTHRRRADRRVTASRDRKASSLRRKAVICCHVGAVLITGIFGYAAVLIHNSYTSFAEVIDQQIAGGYLRSHAGLYAAPRIIEKGAVFPKTSLRCLYKERAMPVIRQATSGMAVSRSAKTASGYCLAREVKLTNGLTLSSTIKGIASLTCLPTTSLTCLLRVGARTVNSGCRT